MLPNIKINTLRGHVNPKTFLSLGLIYLIQGCGGGGGTNAVATQNQSAYYKGVDCVASNGTDDGYVMGVCETKDGAGSDIARTSFQDIVALASSSKASPTLATVTSKSLGIVLKTPIDPLATSLTFGANTDCATYYSFFGNLRGMTLSQFTGANASLLVDVTSLASVVPGIDGPARGQAAGPCGNKVVEPTLDPSITLTGLDFGLYRYYAGSQYGPSDASYNGGWYSRFSGASTTPSSDTTFNTSGSRLAAYYSTPTGMWTTSSVPTKASWTKLNNTLRIEVKGTWYHHTPGSRAGAAPSPALGAFIFTGVADVNGKVSGFITSDSQNFGIDVGRFEGEFNSTGSEFAGRFVAKVTGANARLGGAMAFKL